jgi:hypothetical protein
MSDKLKKLEIKKIIQEYVFIRSDLEYKQTIFDENLTPFLEEVHNTTGESVRIIEPPTSIDLKSNNEPTSNNHIPLSENNNETVKLLYREISKKVHPDKDIHGFYTGLFNRATSAYENGNLVELCEICEKIDIPYIIKSDDLIELQKNLVSIRKNKKMIESSFVYLWWANPNKEIRQSIIEQYISTRSNSSK